MFVWTFLLRITHTIISQSSADSSWITLYLEMLRKIMKPSGCLVSWLRVEQGPPEYKSYRAVSNYFISEARVFVSWICHFYGEQLSAPRPTPQARGPPLVDCPWLLIQYICGTLHIGGRSSICNLRTPHAVVTGTHLSWPLQMHMIKFKMRSIVIFWAP